MVVEVCYFKILSQHSPEQNKENQDKESCQRF